MLQRSAVVDSAGGLEKSMRKSRFGFAKTNYRTR